MSSDIHCRVISQEVSQPSITKICLKIICPCYVGRVFLDNMVYNVKCLSTQRTININVLSLISVHLYNYHNNRYHFALHSMGSGQIIQKTIFFPGKSQTGICSNWCGSTHRNTHISTCMYVVIYFEGYQLPYPARRHGVLPRSTGIPVIAPHSWCGKYGLLYMRYPALSKKLQLFILKVQWITVLKLLF